MVKKKIYRTVILVLATLIIFSGNLLFKDFIGIFNDKETLQHLIEIERKALADDLPRNTHPVVITLPPATGEELNMCLRELFLSAQIDTYWIALLENDPDFPVEDARTIAQAKLILFFLNMDHNKKSLDEVGIPQEDVDDCRFFLFGETNLIELCEN